MATRSNPSKFCRYNKLNREEPYYVLAAGSHRLAPRLLAAMADSLEQEGGNMDEVIDMRKTVQEMLDFQRRIGKIRS